MNLIELTNNNISKKWGAMFGSLIAISQANDEIQAWQMTIVAVAYMVMQSIIDWRKQNGQTKVTP